MVCLGTGCGGVSFLQGKTRLTAAVPSAPRRLASSAEAEGSFLATLIPRLHRCRLASTAAHGGARARRGCTHQGALRSHGLAVSSAGAHLESSLTDPERRPEKVCVVGATGRCALATCSAFIQQG